jgi:hypothetical protein
MGLFDKTNPRATGKSVMCSTLLGGIAGFGTALVLLSLSDMPTSAWFLMLPWMTAWCAVTGAAMEWQLPC